MNAELAVNYILANDSSYRAKIGSTVADARIFYDQAEQTQKTPFSIIKGSEIEPTDNKDRASDMDFDFVYVTHFAKDKTTVAEMASLARTALDRKAAGTYQGITIETIHFVTQRSDSDFLVDKPVKTIEQLYKIITQQ